MFNNYFIDETFLFFIKILPKKININFIFEEKEYDNIKNILIKDYKLLGILDDKIIINNNYICELINPKIQDKNIVKISNLELIGEKSNNYYIDNIQFHEIKINKKKVYIDFYFEEKIYDGTNICKLINYKINGIINNDQVNINNNILLYYYENKDVLEKNRIIIKNIKLIDCDSLNYYTIENSFTFGKIKKKYINTNFFYTPKIYDGNNDIIVNGNLLNIIENDINDLKLYWKTSKYEHSNCGKNKIIVSDIYLLGNKSNNYFTDSQNIFNGYIEKFSLNLIINNNIKEYDGTNKIIFDGQIEKYNFNFKYNNSYYINEFVGDNKIIIVDGVELLENNNNFKIKSKFIFNGIIKKRKIDIEFLYRTKIFDNTNICHNKPIINFINIIETRDNIIETRDNIIETININQLTFDCFYQDINVGIQNIIINNINLDNPNYFIDFNEKIIKSLILPQKINITSIDKIYDGMINAKINTTLYYEAYYEDKNVGNKKIKVKLKNKNYICDKNIYGNILPKEIIGIPKIKTYDGTNNAEIILDGIINGDNVFCEGYFEKKVVNEDIIVYGILNGFDKNNYILNKINNGIIIKKKITGIPEDKIYDSTTNIQIKLNNIILNDDVYVLGNSLTSDVNNKVKVVGNLFGNDSINYELINGKYIFVPGGFNYLVFFLY
jgi:hypothetical protein